MSQIDLSIVVPVYNNASTLEELIDRLTLVLGELACSWEAIFVDDGSRDRSLAVLEGRAASDARIRVFPLTRNFGGQAAICAGFDQVRGKRTVCMDADLENFPEDIPSLLAALDAGHDLACGIREGRRDALLTRKLPSALLNAYVRRQTGTRVRDIGCGMRAMESWIVHGLADEGERRRLVTPLLLRRARAVAQIPIRHRPKGVPGGHSFLTLLGIAMDYYLLTARRPFLIAGLLSAVGIVVGLLLLAWGAGSWGLGGLVLAVGGLLGGLLSLVGEYVQRLYQVGQDLPFYQLQEQRSEGAPADYRSQDR